MGKRLTVDVLTGAEQTYEADRVFFTGLLQARTPFAFVRFGDAEFECMAGYGTHNRDRTQYTRELGDALIGAFRSLSQMENVYLAQRCAPHLREKMAALVDLDGRRYYDADALLLHYRSFSLETFYRTLIQDERRKIYVAPACLNQGMKLLGCARRVNVKRPDAFSEWKEISADLAADNADDTIFLFSAGMGSKVWIAELMAEGKRITCIDLGSALDPVYIGQTRSGQPRRGDAMTFFWRMGMHP